MMHKLLPIMAVVAMLFVLPAGMAYTLNGTLTDSCGSKLSGVTVALNVSGNSTTTSATGVWNFGVKDAEDNLPNSTYQLTATAPSSQWKDKVTNYILGGNNNSNALTMSKNYCATYGATDVPGVVVDIIGGVLVGLAQSANPLVWAIVAGMILTIMVGVVLLFKRMKNK